RQGFDLRGPDFRRPGTETPVGGQQFFRNGDREFIGRHARHSTVDGMTESSKSHHDSRLPEAAGERVDYVSTGLVEDELADTPGAQFIAWFHDAERLLGEPNAVVLATAG